MLDFEIVGIRPLPNRAPQLSQVGIVFTRIVRDENQEVEHVPVFPAWSFSHIHTYFPSSQGKL